MNISELRSAAKKKGCYLVIPRKSIPKGASIRMFGRSGPLGIVCNVRLAECGFDIVACFNGSEVLAYLDKHPTPPATP